MLQGSNCIKTYMERCTYSNFVLLQQKKKNLFRVFIIYIFFLDQYKMYKMLNLPTQTLNGKLLALDE